MRQSGAHRPLLRSAGAARKLDNEIGGENATKPGSDDARRTVHGCGAQAAELDANLGLSRPEAVYDDVPLERLADVKAYVPVRKNVESFNSHFLGGQLFGGVSLSE